MEDKQAKILALITSDMVRDSDDVPTYEDKKTTFYWGAWSDSPVLPYVRIWVLFDKPVSEQDSIKIVKERVG